VRTSAEIVVLSHPACRHGRDVRRIPAAAPCSAVASPIDELHTAAGLIGLWPGGTPRPSPFEEAAAEELERRLERGLASLPATYREVLLLVGVEGLSPSEAARVCEVSPEALRQRLSRARSMLIRELEVAPARVVARLGEVAS
jgi:RNA polymerase sigma factor (sigma-70 family)